MKTYAVLPAAGQGKRFGSVKQFQEVCGKPVFLHTLEVFENSPLITGYCLVIPEDLKETARSLIPSSFKKLTGLVAGGKERQDSVQRGFESLPACDVVVVHDAVRLLLTADILERSVQAAVKDGASVVGIPVKDTTKRVQEGKVQETLDRSVLWSIQTPQTFRYEILQKALQKASKDGFLGTDEAMMVERLGVPITVVEGSPYNLKITTPEDLVIAESLLRKRTL